MRVVLWGARRPGDLQYGSPADLRRARRLMIYARVLRALREGVVVLGNAGVTARRVAEAMREVQ